MAARFWVGGTGTWDPTSTAHWAASSGGASGASAPGSADTVTIDANSGSGTITTNFSGGAGSGTLTIGLITTSAMNMTLDFSANNDSLTTTSSTAWSNSGSGNRTINLGSGTFTLAGGYAGFTVTNLTLNAGTSTILINPAGVSAASFQSGAKSFNNVTFTPASKSVPPLTITNSSCTIANLTLNGNVLFGSSATTTITGSFTMNGVSGSPLSMAGSNNGTTFALGSSTFSMSWVAISLVAFTATATPTASNSFDCGGNSNITINQPSGGGGGLITNPGMSGGMA